MERELVEYYGILFHCPYGQSSEDCYLIDIDHLPLMERFQWFENLDFKDKVKIIEHHKKCTQKRRISE